ncbi:MAG: dTMP kinase [Omnitrophica WOR_2 bacterium RIFCSPHIGHO2_01_FULL_48_9]|nr:MAG: dTMP kinase [Omnitrophica WOR_2 bacterium RIFCSPHIGHO2_01_FULL_48_9]
MGLKGKFITLEGAEGSGKSTQGALIYAYLKSKKKKVLLIREPGGVKISESIRHVLLDVKNKQMTKECETLLYMAARSQLVAEVIVPALEKGHIVLCDRFLDSTIVYQGYGNGVDIDFIKKLGRFATQGVQPDLTLLFDIETKKGLSRKGKIKDRIELRPLAYHNRVRQGYLELAKAEPRRIKVIKVDRSKEEIFAIVRRSIDRLADL